MQPETLWLATDADTGVIVGIGTSQNQNRKRLKTSDDRQRLEKPWERCDIEQTIADIELGSSSANGE